MTAFRHGHSDDEFDTYLNITLGFETLFALHVILQFFKAYKDNSKGKIITDQTEIANNYFWNGFIFESIPLIPLQYLSLKNNR